MLGKRLSILRVVSILLIFAMAIPTTYRIEVRSSATVTLYPIMDSYVTDAEGKNNANFGGQSELKVSFSGNTFVGYSITFIMFDVSSIPNNVEITQASISLYVGASVTETHDILIHRCEDTSWDEYTITWENKPAFNFTGWPQIVEKGSSWYTWTAGPTEMIKNLFKTTNDRITFVIACYDFHQSAVGVEFYSRDQVYEWTEEYRPTLAITYETSSDVDENDGLMTPRLPIESIVIGLIICAGAIYLIKRYQ